MGARFERKKGRHWLASIAYKIDRFIPLSPGKKLDFLLDLEWVANRLAYENAGRLDLTPRHGNPFLLDGIKPTDRVLDLGCSDGQVLRDAKAAEIVGVDYNQESIDRARSTFPDRTFVCADVRDYLKRRGHFDVLVMSHILEHMDEGEEFLGSIKDHFDRIYIEVPDFEWSASNMFRQKRGRRLIYMDNDHVAEFDRYELERIFDRLGLEIDDREFRHGVMRYWLRSGSSSKR